MWLSRRDTVDVFLLYCVALHLKRRNDFQLSHVFRTEKRRSSGAQHSRTSSGRMSAKRSWLLMVFTKAEARQEYS